ncbi:hypothetical protein Pcinc_005071 [Petrolisthes cinctipes]|uniref:PBZ-type domain-containing protein n=1 Tax=Petrolisthes cinctipes TaxID=88211 RepID=A0AAE1GFY8_PETCI|nr:hypothetical protein Pcinc_005071 [Petrolisthes cinctipes]
MSVTLLRIQAPGSDENIDDRNDQKIIVSLPVVLGRGSLLKCGEKKVSRRHAYLDWEDDGVQITSVHQNPTFIVVKGEEKQLTEGSFTLLNHGDMFGLMESSFWYKVCMQETVTCRSEEGEGNVSNSKTNPQAPPTQEGEEQKERRNKKETELGEKCSPELEEGAFQSDKENKDVNNEKKKETNDDQNNDQVSSTREEERLPEMSNTSEVSMNQEPKKIGALTKQQDPDSTTFVTTNIPAPIISQQQIQSSVLERKRKLPSWMTSNKTTKAEGGADTSNSNTTALHPHGGGRKAHTPSSRKKKNNRTSDIDSQSVESESPNKKEDRDKDGNEQRKRQKKMDTPSANTPEKKMRNASPKKTPNKKNKNVGKSPLKQGGKNLHNMSDEGSEGDVEDNESTGHVADTSGTVKAFPATPKVSPVKPKASTKNLKKASPPVKPALSDSDEDVTTSGVGEVGGNNVTSTSTVQQTSTTPTPPRHPTAAPPPGTPRQSCQYGANCYRKNPLHRQQLAHPGDPDYHDAGSEDDANNDDDDRPECEYGVDCYRKNPQHRRQYKHTRFPQPQRKAKRKARQPKAPKADYNTDSEDDYDYDDPFLNDSSTDDYAPSDCSSDSFTEPSQEVEEEDTTRMLKEGKKFVRRRR